MSETRGRGLDVAGLGRQCSVSPSAVVRSLPARRSRRSRSAARAVQRCGAGPVRRCDSQGRSWRGRLFAGLGLHMVNLAPATRRQLYCLCRDYSPRGFPAASSVWLGCERLESNWSGRRDSNPRPRPWQGRALPLSYHPHPRRGDCSRATARAMPNAARECNSPSAPEFAWFGSICPSNLPNRPKRPKNGHRTAAPAELSAISVVARDIGSAIRTVFPPDPRAGGPLSGTN